MKIALSVLFLLSAAAMPAQDREFGVAVPTTLTQIRAEPEAYKNVKLHFTVQFASLGRMSNPFFTKFTPTDFTNFYAWADEQPIWQQPAYEDVFGMLFLSKNSKKLDRLFSLQLYQRIHATGIVRNTFQGVPWIEVLDFDVLGEHLDTATLTHLSRGEKMMSQRLWQRAMAELTLAPGKAVPPHATRAAHKNLGICLLRIGEVQLALSYLQSAANLVKCTDAELDNLLAIAKTHPAQAIDRTVDARGIKDSERPMWEAFDGDQAPRITKVLR